MCRENCMTCKQLEVKKPYYVKCDMKWLYISYV